MTFTIPQWVLWLLAVPVGIAGLALMAMGVMFLRLISGWRYK